MRLRKTNETQRLVPQLKTNDTEIARPRMCDGKISLITSHPTATQTAWTFKTHSAHTDGKDVTFGEKCARMLMLMQN